MRAEKSGRLRVNGDDVGAQGLSMSKYETVRNSFTTAFTWVFWIAVIGGGLWWFSDYGETLRYVYTYHVDPAKVRVNPKPHDCDYYRAPLGYKGCHYEETVAAYNADGAWVGGDGAPKWGHDKVTGKPIVSVDGGKTWELMGGDPVPDQTVNRPSSGETNFVIIFP